MVENITFLLENSIIWDENYDLSGLLKSACGGNNLEITKLLNKLGADVNANVGTYYCPLQFAIRQNKIETVKFLVENGVDVNAYDELENIPFLLAIYFAYDTEILKYLVQHGADSSYIVEYIQTINKISED